jgi:hypothetical protein
MGQLRHLANMCIEENELLSNRMLVVVEWFIHRVGGFKYWILF